MKWENKGKRDPGKGEHVDLGKLLGSHLLFTPGLSWMFLLPSKVSISGS